MSESTIDSRPTRVQTPQRLRHALPFLILLIVVTAALIGYTTWKAFRPASTSTEAEYMTAAELEQRYGLRVRLLGVTGGGGMVDFRLKILDVQKAREFLQDPGNLPRLVAADGGKALVGTQGLDDDISWEEGGILFIFFSNSDGLIQPGTPVIVEFGDLQLEPIPAQ